MFDASPSWFNSNQRSGATTAGKTLMGAQQQQAVRKPLTSPINRMRPPTQPRMGMPPSGPGMPTSQPPPGPMGITLGGGPNTPTPQMGPMGPIGPSMPMGGMPLGNPSMPPPMIGGPQPGPMIDTAGQLPGLAQLISKMGQSNTGITGGNNIAEPSQQPGGLWSAYNQLSSGLDPVQRRGMTY